MGANATTFVPAYVSGEVLTAADLSVTNSGIPVFADSTARDNSFGGTGEKVLAEGQFAYLESTNATQYYDGAAWQSVGVTPGLVFITGATFSAVTSVSLPADTFSATYTNYLVMFSATSTTNGQISFRYRTAGTDNTNSSYSYANVGFYSNGNSASNNGNAVSAIQIGSVDNALPTFITLDVQNPQTSDRTTTTGQIVWPGNTTTALATSYALGAIFNNTTSFDSMTLISTFSMTGYYKVYGYSNS